MVVPVRPGNRSCPPSFNGPVPAINFGGRPLAALRSAASSRNTRSTAIRGDPFASVYPATTGAVGDPSRLSSNSGGTPPLCSIRDATYSKPLPGATRRVRLNPSDKDASALFCRFLARACRWRMLAVKRMGCRCWLASTCKHSRSKGAKAGGATALKLCNTANRGIVIGTPDRRLYLSRIADSRTVPLDG